MKQEWVVYDENELGKVASELLNFTDGIRFFCLHGEMGAGKTTFIKALVKELKVNDTVSSPTFSIVNEYETVTGERIYHFDFYRIKSLEEVYDIGYENYFFSGNYCFIEWPEKIKSLLNFPKADIFMLSDLNQRFITCIYE